MSFSSSCLVFTSVICLIGFTRSGRTEEQILPDGDRVRTVQVGDLERRYRVHYPEGHDAGVPGPVVIAFHGGGGNPESMVRLSGLNEKSDEVGFIAVYPYGTGVFADRFLTFNGGECCGPAMKNGVDEPAFVRALLDDLGSVVKIDDGRVFATGLSNGAIVSYRVASAVADRIAAIAPVGGPMMMGDCAPVRPVAVMHFHGTEDAFAPIDGGYGKRATGGRGVTEFRSVAHSIRCWVEANGCEPEPEVVELPDRSEDGMRVIRKTWGGGREGTEVVLVEIEGGGHTWPGREPTVALLGASTRDISANDLMWEFFQRHARGDAAAAPQSRRDAVSPPSSGPEPGLADDYWPPVDSWETVTAAEAGADEEALTAALDYAGARNSKAVVILRGGRILAERYWDGWSEQTTGPMYSATKSVVATLVGMAIEEGSIESEDQKSAAFLEEWRGYEEKERIQIRHLLGMNAGLEGGRRTFVRGILSRDEREFATGLPSAHAPGEFWEYHNSAYRLLFPILEESTGRNLAAYSFEKLFRPLGMTQTSWNTKARSPDYTFLQTTARDAARFGLFILRKGEWSGDQLLDPAWVERSARPAIPELNPSYGYLWWLNGGDFHYLPMGDQRREGPLFPECPPDAFAALGKDDQKIYVVPSLDLVAVRLGDAADQTSPAISDFDDRFLGMICRVFEGE